MKGRAKEWTLRMALLVVSLVVALGLAEALLTAFFPLYGGRDNVAMDGTPITEWFPAGTVYRQLTNEYDARTTITDKGHRVPEPTGSPDLVFLGDSFTYGFGLHDEQTFASIYCTATKRNCANLGIPATGIFRQTRRLEDFLNRWQWRPKEVKLFFFGMSGSWSNGNDFVDNYNFSKRTEAAAAGQSGGSAPAVPQPTPSPSLARRIISSQNFLLEHSNLVRRVKYNWGPMLKTALVDPPNEQRMKEALQYTKDGLARFDELSRRVGFEYSIYLIVPVQDIKRGTYGETLAALNSVSPKPAIPTGQLFTDQPESYYYAYDGHLNPKGAQRIADFLLEADRGSHER